MVVNRGFRGAVKEDMLETIEDDDEFERIADIFDDEFADIFYDDQP